MERYADSRSTFDGPVLILPIPEMPMAHNSGSPFPETIELRKETKTNLETGEQMRFCVLKYADNETYAKTRLAL